MIDPWVKKHYSRIYTALLLMAAILYAVLALSGNVWADEAYTFALIRHSLPEIWTITAADVHPPLYYFIAKAVAAPLGYSQYVLRILSAACLFAVLAIGGKQIRSLFDERTALLFMALLLLFPFLLPYAVEIRMYALCALTVFLNALFAYRVWLWNRKWDWFGFAAAGICSAYSHYFALVSVGIIYGILFLLILFQKRQLLKPWLIVSIFTVIAYLPWLKCFAEQLAFKVNNEYWIEPITSATILGYYKEVFGASQFPNYHLLFLPVILTALFFCIRRKAWPALLALCVPFLTTLLGVGVSLLIRPIFISRYLAPTIPLFVFFLSYGLSCVTGKVLPLMLAAIILSGYSWNTLIQLARIRPQDHLLDNHFTQQYAQAEAYVVENEASLHISQVLSYYEPVTPIYVPDTLGPDNPYPNKFEQDAYPSGAYSTVIILTDVGQEPSAGLSQGYTVSFLGTYAQPNCTMDVWLLTKTPD